MNGEPALNLPVLDGCTYTAVDAPVYGPDGPVWSDVVQHRIGDCWLLSSLMALVQRDPGFVADTLHDEGTDIRVRLYDRAGPHDVRVSRLLPMAPDGTMPGAQGPDGPLWPAYVEKAAAALYRSPFGHTGYRGIDDDVSWHAMRLLTGHPGRVVLMFPFEALYDDVASGRPVTLGTGPHWLSLRDDLVPNHYYLASGVSGDRVVLTNPWGPDGSKPYRLEIGPADLLNFYSMQELPPR